MVTQLLVKDQDLTEMLEAGMARPFAWKIRWLDLKHQAACHTIFIKVQAFQVT